MFQDVLENDEIKLDWMFRYSIMQDIVRVSLAPSSMCRLYFQYFFIYLIFFLKYLVLSLRLFLMSLCYTALCCCIFYMQEYKI